MQQHNFIVTESSLSPPSSVFNIINIIVIVIVLMTSFLILMLTESPPEIKIEPSTYSSDFKKVMDDTRSADVLFQFEDGSASLYAHKIILLLTPSIFKDVLLDANCDNFENFKDLLELTEISNDSDEIALDDSRSKISTQVRTCILLKSWISHETFIRVLEFFYTGEAEILKVTELNKVKDILAASEKLKVQPLVEVCNYFLKPVSAKKENLDHSDKELVPLQPTPQRPHVVHDLFLDLQATTFSDVSFLVEDTVVRAHKAILMARSPYIAALLSGNFKDTESAQVVCDVIYWVHKPYFKFLSRPVTKIKKIKIKDVNH